LNDVIGATGDPHGATSDGLSMIEGSRGRVVRMDEDVGGLVEGSKMFTFIVTWLALGSG